MSCGGRGYDGPRAPSTAHLTVEPQVLIEATDLDGSRPCHPRTPPPTPPPTSALPDRGDPSPSSPCSWPLRVLSVHATSCPTPARAGRSEEHTSELQSLMRISYAVFCLKKKIE